MQQSQNGKDHSNILDKRGLYSVQFPHMHIILQFTCYIDRPVSNSLTKELVDLHLK